MIDYSTYCQIHQLHKKGLKVSQIGAELNLDPKTVQAWIEQPSFQPRKTPRRSSKLDAFKGPIVALLERHAYTAQQIFQQLLTQGYAGGYTILKEFVRLIRPPRKPAFLMLEFAPGECAQVDWGQYGSVQVQSTRRRLSFFVMVLCHSRMMYVEFTLSEAMEQFLSCHRHAFEFLGGVPQKVMIDNLKVGVVRHPTGEKALFNPHYADFAAHYGFVPVACNVRKGNEKGRVENGVGYIKKNFLNGLEIPSFQPVNPAARQWMDTVANVRIHGETGQKPIERFEQEKAPAQAPAGDALRLRRHPPNSGQPLLPRPVPDQPLLGTLPLCLPATDHEGLPGPVAVLSRRKAHCHSCPLL
jgi:transposase